MEDIGQELRNFLTYIAKGGPVDDFTRELEHEVEEARQNRGWEEEYMTLQMIKRECYNEGKNEGKALELITNIEQLRKNLGLSLEAPVRPWESPFRNMKIVKNYYNRKEKP